MNKKVTGQMWGQGNPGVLEELIRKWEDYFTGQARPFLKEFYQNVKELYKV